MAQKDDEEINLFLTRDRQLSRSPAEVREYRESPYFKHRKELAVVNGALHRKHPKGTWAQVVPVKLRSKALKQRLRYARTTRVAR